MIGIEPRQPKGRLVESHLDTATVLRFHYCFVLMAWLFGTKGYFHSHQEVSVLSMDGVKKVHLKRKMSFLLRQYLLNMLSRIPWVPTLILPCYFKCVLK